MNQSLLNFRAIQQNFDSSRLNLIMTTIMITRTHRQSSSILCLLNLSHSLNQRLSLQRIINSQLRMINSSFQSTRNQSLKFSQTHLNVIAIDFENISHRLHIWVSCSTRRLIFRISLSTTFRSRYLLSLSVLRSIRSFTSLSLILLHLDKRR
jgi:hypothetical protein